MSRLLMRDGAQLEYRSHGRGRVIVFVHGWLCSSRIWDAQLYALGAHYRCVAYDLRGMGLSDKGEGPHDFDTFAADLRQVLQHVEAEDVTLVGWSMGVSVVLSYLQRFAGDGHVGRVALVNGPIKLINSADWPYGIDQVECLGYINSLAERPVVGRREFAQANLHAPSEAEVDFMFDLSMQTPLDIALEAVHAQMALDQRPVLTTLAVPCLAMQSEHDFYPVALAEYIAGAVPDGASHVFAGCGHSVQLQNPLQFNTALAKFIEAT